MNTFDFTIIGGGIVGISTAWQLLREYPDADILLVEKETATARHQTGRNSGVIHAGVYYAPGSLKAEFCKRGAAATFAFCNAHGLPVHRCGKLLVATDERELSRMADLEKRCAQNGIATHRWTTAELAKQEPNINSVGALHVPATGITDYTRIAAKMAALFKASGGQIRFGLPLTAAQEVRDHVSLTVGDTRLRTRYLVACAGLMADRLTAMMGIAVDFRIIPFRGEYYRLPNRHNGIVRHLIYPIPDPDLPFLGVHLTRMIDGSVTVGPNAVLGWKREGYARFNLSLRDTWEMVTYKGFWKVMRTHFKAGVGEFRDSWFKRGYLRRVQRYCPRLTAGDLRPYPAGIRAQAVRMDGTLVHDFLFAETQRSLHVCNAPSPAATSAIPIGAYLVEKIKKKFDL
ncbi:MAG: L-2-hydroxyglutarate oxidase [Desulfobacteraceae bacterium]